EQYVQVAEAVCAAAIASAIELNVSCPNVKQGGLAFGKDCDTLKAVVSAVRQKCTLPLWVKLTPNVTDIGSLARAAEEAGADALVAVNTFVGMALDIERGAPALGNRIGGLSGPAIKPLALYAVDQVVRATGIPVVAVGGISSGRDALEFMALGAVAFQIGTSLMIDPCCPLAILSEMQEILAEKGLSSIQDWIGIAKAW
ncbi:MAG TPA: nitronate monooxygenase, partial [bacterium]|nr:nitronate monooxygenase [bacterium]